VIKKKKLYNNKMDNKKVLVTGITGQDGYNMCNYLLNNTNYLIYGTTRNIKNNINFKSKRFIMKILDLIDYKSIEKTFLEIKPDYFINFAGQSSVNDSWKKPENTFKVNSLSIIYILELIRSVKPSCRFYSAGSSEEFGDIKITPQTLEHPLKPRSPYGASKCAARHIVKVYRDSYNLFAIHCVLFNHEGIRRNKKFVTRKITHNLARIKYEIESGLKPKPFELGNINVKRDWSDSEDFIEAIWIMLNKEKPNEYILSSNKSHSIEDFINISCKCLNLNYKWEKTNNPFDTKLFIDNNIVMTISEKFFRPADLDIMVGDCSGTLKELNWKPKTNFENLVKKMTDYDYNLIRNNGIIK
jgi:GDPmannose 4,6-dehydratase